MKRRDSTELDKLLDIYSTLDDTKPNILKYFNYVCESLCIPKAKNVPLTLEGLYNPQMDKYFDDFCKRLHLLALLNANLIPEKLNKQIEPWEIELIPNALAFMEKMPEKSEVMKEIEEAADLELPILSSMFAVLLFHIFFSNKIEGKEGGNNLFRIYLLCFGFYLYVERECCTRIHNANKIDPKDSDTFFASPVPYQAFYELSKDPLKNQKSQHILDQLKGQAENKTKGYYHPDDDAERTIGKKFYPEAKTEAEGLYDQELSKILAKKFQRLTLLKSIEKPFIWDQDLAMFPYSYKMDLINTMDSHEAKKRGITIEKWRELRKEIEEEEKRVGSNEVPPDRLEQLYRYSKALIKEESSVVLTDEEDYEDIPSETQLSGDSIEYVIADPEETAEVAEGKEYAIKKIMSLIREHTDSLTPQAKGEKAVGYFLLRKGIAKYINERGQLNITKIHKDSWIPLSTVKRFCKGLFSKFSGNK